MATILENIQNPRAFDAFVNENMKNSTYKIGWDREMDVEYEASENWTAATADYAAAMLGTVIDSNADRPKRDMPSIGELSGAMARIADEWQIPNDRLKKLYFMENRFRDRSKNLTEEQQKAEFAKLIRYLFNPYELAAIAPHRRILAQYLEGLSDAQVTLTKTNNEGGIVWSSAIPTGISKKKLRSTDVVWSTATLGTMDVLKVLEYIESIADAAGKGVIKHRISKATASLICQCDQFKNLIGLSIGKIRTQTTPGIGLDTINQYLASINGTGYAPFEVVNEIGLRDNTGAFSLFKDGRISAMCADRVAVLKVTDPLELIDPVPNKVYTSYFDNLISQWRNEKGRYVAYEMFAFPAFVGKNDVFVINTAEKEA